MIALFKRDVLLAFRLGGGVGLALVFFLILIVLTAFGVGPNPSRLAVVAPGILWVGALLACLLSLERIFGSDAEDGSLEMLMTSPVPMEGVFVAKAMAHWVTTGLPLTLMSPVLAFMMNLETEAVVPLVLSLLLGTPALSLIGAFGASVTLGVKRGGLLLSLLVLPMYMPTLIMGADVVRSATQGIAYGTPLLAAAAITLLSLALLPFASGFALRSVLR